MNDDIKREAEALKQALVEDEHRGTGRIVRTRRWLWTFLEKPQMCLASRVTVLFGKLTRVNPTTTPQMKVISHGSLGQRPLI